jgi:pantoate--beta-alanine ligase
MKIIRSVGEMQQEAELLRLAKKKIGLVPTMGYLHAGHESLIAEARRSSDIVVLSIFVNPTQFSPSEDYSRYPRDFERDKGVAEKAGVDIVFSPEARDVYAEEFSTYVEEQEVSRILEGKFRPTHFRGVTTIVAKLINICKPHVAVFGQKDTQQAFIVGKMIRDLNFDVKVIVAPIVREADGLALSSRNVYLSPGDRKNATVLHESLRFAEREISGGETAVGKIRPAMEKLIRSKGAPVVDYIAFLDPEQFRETDTITIPTVLIALAARFGRTRLIDNVLVRVEGS